MRRHPFLNEAIGRAVSSVYNVGGRSSGPTYPSVGRSAFCDARSRCYTRLLHRQKRGSAESLILLGFSSRSGNWRRGRDSPTILSDPRIFPRKAAVGAGYGILRGLHRGLLLPHPVHRAKMATIVELRNLPRAAWLTAPGSGRASKRLCDHGRALHW